MAQQPAIIQTEKTYWGESTHELCVKAIDPCDSYLKLYQKQYRKSIHYNYDTDKNNKKAIDFRCKTMNIINPTINDILFDDTLWAKHYRYKHKNRSYLLKSTHEPFSAWYNKINENNIHQIPQKNQRNCITLVPITDDKTYFIDYKLIGELEELVTIYFGLKMKSIDISNTNNILFRKNTFDNFLTKDIHNKLSTYFNNDKDIFAIIGICSKIGIYNENKIIHSEHNNNTQSAVVSFSKLGVYNKLQRNIPQWLKIRRCGKILLHEIAHLFGLGNCEYFRCLMNKDIVLDCVPIHLCPICLNKLYYAMIKQNNHRNTFEYQLPHHNDIGIGIQGIDDEAIIIRGGTDDEKEKRKKKMKIDPNTFNLYQRYKDLAKWFNDHKCFRESTWYKQRINSLNITNQISGI